MLAALPASTRLLKAANLSARLSLGEPRASLSIPGWERPARTAPVWGWGVLGVGVALTTPFSFLYYKNCLFSAFSSLRAFCCLPSPVLEEAAASSASFHPGWMGYSAVAVATSVCTKTLCISPNSVWVLCSAGPPVPAVEELMLEELMLEER